MAWNIDIRTAKYLQNLRENIRYLDVGNKISVTKDGRLKATSLWVGRELEYEKNNRLYSKDIEEEFHTQRKPVENLTW